MIVGLGTTVGKALAMHLDVDMVTFTGSTHVGRLMMQYAGQSNMKVVLAECGGKSPHMVFADGVDLEQVGRTVARRILTNQGQICSAGSRLLVQRSIEAPLLEKIAEEFSDVVMGNALRPETTFGPLASAQQCSRVLHYIRGAASEGAQLVLGGARVLQETGGYFVEPTLFRNVLPSSRMAQEEIFGPVLSVMTFADEAEAIRMANGTASGLAAYVWTTRLVTALRVAKAIRSSVWVNAGTPAGEGAGHAASFEPAGLSGVGTEGGLAGLESCLRRQMISIDHG